MFHTFSLPRRNLPVSLLAAIGIGLALPPAVSAPPGPGAPKPPPKAAPAGAPKRASPKPPPKHPGPKPPLDARPARDVLLDLRRPHYWHPNFRALPPKTIWAGIGYPYYVGNTSYVIAPPSADEQGPADQPTTASPAVTWAAPEDAASADRYVQIQKLTDLVHAWRTMNESPALHERVMSSAGSGAGEPAFVAFRSGNQKFDELTRAAMSKLAQGESAQRELEFAAAELEKLIERADALPVPTTRPGSVHE